MCAVVWNCLVLDFYIYFGVCENWPNVGGYKRQSALAHGHFWHSCTLGVFFSSRHRTACYLVKVEQYAIFQVKVAGLCNRVCGRSRGRERWMRSFRTVWKIISLPSNENKPDTPRPPFLPRARKRTIGLVNHCRSISSRSSGAEVKEKKWLFLTNFRGTRPSLKFVPSKRICLTRGRNERFPPFDGIDVEKKRNWDLSRTNLFLL